MRNRSWRDSRAVFWVEPPDQSAVRRAGVDLVRTGLSAPRRAGRPTSRPASFDRQAAMCAGSHRQRRPTSTTMARASCGHFSNLPRSSTPAEERDVLIINDP